MKHLFSHRGLMVLGVAAVMGAGFACSYGNRGAKGHEARHPSGLLDYFNDTEDSTLNESEKFGREIWYKATVGNARHHTYVMPQRLIGAHPDFARYFGASSRDKRFDRFGLINDPDCCTPGSAGCPAKSLDETYGLDWCPGQDEVNAFFKQLVAYQQDPAKNAKPQYRDPACDLKDPEMSGGAAGKQSPCSLDFGTSTGVMGFRKFPNPQFVPEKWKGWDHYRDNAKDTSQQPPYLVGVSCGSCHIAFNPAKPPADPNHPKYENIKGTVGNQYLVNAAIFASGATRDSLEWQLFRYDRPGTSDTSAVMNDQIYNPGTINAIINFPKRPKFTDDVKNWRIVSSCDVSNRDTCMKDVNGKFWENATKTEEVLHILKGGEDGIGPLGALQRVYVNIGTCSESCWMNHSNDLRSIDPTQRNFNQTPFEVGQCRRDCPSYRAIEDRIGDVGAFLFSAKQTDLADALQTDQAGLESWLEQKGYTKGSVDRGREVYKQQCAECHSSKDKASLANVTFREMDDHGMREDWLGSDVLRPISEIKTYGCRALHTNHKKGHVWEQFASATYRNRTQNPTFAPALKGITSGGPGFYRAISLVNAWAYAPFMHNNAVGPEICPRVQDSESLPAPEGLGECVPYPVTPEERFSVYEKSMQALLHPEARGKKFTRTDADIMLPVMPGFPMKIPKGVPAAKLSSFDHKAFVMDFLTYYRTPGDPAAFKTKMTQKYKDAAVADKLAAAFKETVRGFIQKGHLEADSERLDFYLSFYTNCNVSGPEDAGHEFGKDLSEDEKRSLTAFLATL